MSLPLNLRVHAMCYGAQGIVSVELRDVDDKALSGYAPGAHVKLRLGNGLVRSYSLCSASEVRNRYVVGMPLDRDNRGGSRYVHKQLHVSSALKIGGPHNHFEMDETASYTVLVAGDIGVTPIVCIAYRLAEQGKAFSMLHCARSHADAAFAGELAGHGDAVRFHLDAKAGGLPNLKALLAGYSTNTHFYCCSPGLMLCAFETACEALGYTNVHIEHSAADPGVGSVQDGGCQVRLARNGAELCMPTNKSLLDVLLKIGIEVEHSYEEGVCGSCETRVLEGEPDHRDSVFSKSERASNQTMMVCVFGCEGKRLVVDL